MKGTSPATEHPGALRRVPGNTPPGPRGDRPRPRPGSGLQGRFSCLPGLYMPGGRQTATQETVRKKCMRNMNCQRTALVPETLPFTFCFKVLRHQDQRAKPGEQPTYPKRWSATPSELHAAKARLPHSGPCTGVRRSLGPQTREGFRKAAAVARTYRQLDHEGTTTKGWQEEEGASWTGTRAGGRREAGGPSAPWPQVT